MFILSKEYSHLRDDMTMTTYLAVGDAAGVADQPVLAVANSLRPRETRRRQRLHSKASRQPVPMVCRRGLGCCVVAV